jgi:D-glycero-alpha-D-manno-heptose 1-phosphate guanylyltransferase
MQAIILAGGKGTRLQVEVPDLPKPLAPVGGRPFLEHQMAYWILQGVDRFILSVGYKAEMIMASVGARFCDAEIVYAVEDQPLGTGGALLHAKRQLRLNERFIVVNGDTFFDLPLPDLGRFHAEKKSDWTLTLFQTKDTERYLGVTLDEDGRLVSLSTRSVQNDVWANGGVYMISPGVLDPVAKRFKGGASLEGEIIPALMALNSAIYGIRCNGRFIDIGVPDDYRRAADILMLKPVCRRPAP